jgi:hypothetical protein
MAVGWMTEVLFPAGREICLFATSFRLALGYTQLPFKWAPRSVHLQLETHHLPSMRVILPPRPLYVLMVCLSTGSPLPLPLRHLSISCQVKYTSCPTL